MNEAVPRNVLLLLLCGRGVQENVTDLGHACSFFMLPRQYEDPPILIIDLTKSRRQRSDRAFMKVMRILLQLEVYFTMVIFSDTS